ncbi:MAG: SDR family oxidoreductase [Chloroflexi bacterium]|nr:SDR family oxidoreductase [Chloroflexota bacterium]
MTKRTVLITGAAGGIGRAIVARFVEAGWEVIGWDKAPQPADFPAQAHYQQVNLADPAAIETAGKKVRAAHPKLHAVVNNAALQIAKPLLETSVEEWDAVHAVNLRAAFLVSKTLFPALRAAGEAGEGAAVVHVSSVHAIATSANIAAYAASKGGLLALTRAMAIEWAPYGIRVNAVLPGAVDTPMLRAGLARGHLHGDAVEAQLAELARRTVNGRIGKPAEIAAAVYFLADESQSSFMTGQPLVVDGGATARLSTE